MKKKSGLLHTFFDTLARKRTLSMHETAMLKHTPLYDEHLQQGALMVDFAGWSMPLHYGSQIEEHHFVRQDAGMFDVSHMGVVDIRGTDAKSFLRYVVANNIDKLKTPGRALYTCMLNHEGGVIDDLIVYYIAPEEYRLVVNASTLEKDVAWLKKQANASNPNGRTNAHSLMIAHLADQSILAVQGPHARRKVIEALSSPSLSSHFFDIKTKITALKLFQFFTENHWLIAATGYTGEDGLEIILPKTDIVALWQALLAVGVHPVGLGARDTLRLEAGLNLYGQDMDETVTPLESNLAWTVSFEPENRDFIGRSALIKQKQLGLMYKLTGLKLIDKGVLRHDQTVWQNVTQVGKITSGSFSPTLKQSIALARVSEKLNNGCTIDIRGKHLKAEVTQPPFVKKTKISEISGISESKL